MHCTAGIIIIPWLMMILHMVRMGMYFCVDSNFQDVGMMVQFVEIWCQYQGEISLYKICVDHSFPQSGAAFHIVVGLVSNKPAQQLLPLPSSLPLYVAAFKSCVPL